MATPKQWTYCMNARYPTTYAFIKQIDISKRTTKWQSRLVVPKYSLLQTASWRDSDYTYHNETLFLNQQAFGVSWSWTHAFAIVATKESNPWEVTGGLMVVLDCKPKGPGFQPLTCKQRFICLSAACTQPYTSQIEYTCIQGFLCVLQKGY